MNLFSSRYLPICSKFKSDILANDQMHFVSLVLLHSANYSKLFIMENSIEKLSSQPPNETQQFKSYSPANTYMVCKLSEMHTTVAPPPSILFTQSLIFRILPASQSWMKLMNERERWTTYNVIKINNLFGKSV